MVERRNVGGVDRAVRGVAGVWLLAVAVGAVVAGRRRTALAAAVAGTGLLANAATGYCGLNALLGVDSCPGDCSRG